MLNYKPNYKAIYPGINDEIEDCLVKSDRKMEYFEHDLKKEKILVNQEKEIVKFIPSREDSYDRQLENYVEFADDSENVENLAEKNIMIEELYECISQLTEYEQALIKDLFFQNKTQTQLAEETGVLQQTISYHLKKILIKLKKMMK